MDLERTLIILKPDTIQRGLMGEVIGRIEQRGMRVIAMKMMWVDEALAERHYGEHKGKSFYEPLLNFITSGPVVAMIVEGPEAIQVMRTMMGATNSKAAAPGTIRGDFGMSNRHNLIHGSDSPASAKREIDLFFETEEILSYQRELEPWVDPDAAWA